MIPAATIIYPPQHTAKWTELESTIRGLVPGEHPNPPKFSESSSEARPICVSPAVSTALGFEYGK